MLLLFSLANSLALHAEEAAPPLIDLDGTFFVQLGLFLLVLFVLSRVLFGPYLKMRADRDHAIAGSKHEAEKMGEDARAIVGDYDRKFADAKRRGADERNQLHLEGTARERELVGKSRAESQTAIDAARKQIVAETEAGRTALTAEAAPLARAIASKVLGREVA
jgi:F-type H+-transporting ATPase subunit b